MRVFQSSYKDRHGQTRKTARFYVEFSDHRAVRRRVPGLTDRRATEALGRNIEALVRFKASGEALPVTLTKWIESLPAKQREPLARCGLLDAGKVAALRPLADHLDGPADAPGWRQHLAAKGNTPGHVDLSVARVRSIIDGCRFAYWSDIAASRVLAFLNERRQDRAKLDAQGKPVLDADGKPAVEPGLSAASFNYYLAAFKGFCRWMVKDGRASESPVAHLDGLNVRTDRRHDRRALTVDELRWLLDVTAAGPVRVGMAGEARSMLYRLAVETGLRAGELRSLTRASFDVAGERATVTVAAGYSKRRRTDVLPLRAETAAKLADYLSAKLPDAPAFTMPSAGHVARMLRADLAAARSAWLADAPTPQNRGEREVSGFLTYRDAAGRVADFHALRHTAGSLLAAAGVHPKVAQSIMRHSTIDLTMSRYTHVFAGQEAGAVADLPDLSAPTRQAAQATGTDGRPVDPSPDATGSPLSGPDGAGRLLDRPAADGASGGHVERPGEPGDGDGGPDDPPPGGRRLQKCKSSVLAVCLALSGGQNHDLLDSAGRNPAASEKQKALENSGETAYSPKCDSTRPRSQVDQGDGLQIRYSGVRIPPRPVPFHALSSPAIPRFPRKYRAFRPFCPSGSSVRLRSGLSGFVHVPAQAQRKHPRLVCRRCLWREPPARPAGRPGRAVSRWRPSPVPAAGGRKRPSSA